MRDTYGLRPEIARYPDAVRYLDRVLAKLQAGLADAGLLEGSVLIFTSDHGEYFIGEHSVPMTKHHFGNPSFESVLRIPLIIAPPIDRNEEDFIRSQDIRGLIGEIAGLGARWGAAA